MPMPMNYPCFRCFPLLVACIAALVFALPSSPARASGAQATNQVFPTTTIGGEVPSITEAIEMHSANPEKFPNQRPASQDPQGNWGPPTNGLLMSVRFGAAAFAVGSPVLVSIVWRNA